MLKTVPTNTGYIAEEIRADYVDEDIPTWTDYDEDNSTQIPIDKRVDTPQRAQLQGRIPRCVQKPTRTHFVNGTQNNHWRCSSHSVTTLQDTTCSQRCSQRGNWRDARIIEPSSSAYGSPMVLVTKKEKSLRICVDYRKLNCQSQADAYPMPRIIDGLGRSHYISTLDLTKGYWQVPVAAEDRPKTGDAIWTTRCPSDFPKIDGSCDSGSQ